MRPAPHTAPIGLLSFLLLVSPHAAHADVGDAMDFVSNSMSLAHLAWLLLMWIAVRRHSNAAQLLGLCAGGVVTAATCIASFLLCFTVPWIMLAGFGAAPFLGVYAGKSAAQGWDDRKNNKLEGESA